jgi:hypothetical protein
MRRQRRRSARVAFGGGASLDEFDDAAIGAFSSGVDVEEL